jgi:nuclear pore complex protein Nup93
MPSASGSLQMHSRMMQYDAVVRRLNNYRKQGYSFGLVSAFGNASAGLNGDSVRPPSRPSRTLLIECVQRTSETTETWQLLAHLVNERQVNKNGEFEREALSERQYAKAYLAEDQNGADATALRKMIGDGAREHLEKQ